MSNTGNFGSSQYGVDPFGSEYAAFGVAGATAYSPHLVQVRFTDLIDMSDTAFLSPSNYVITPSLNVNGVSFYSADSVILQTDVQTFETYTITVGSARSYLGASMLSLNSTTFTGYPQITGFFAAATTPTRVRIVFSGPVQLNAALTTASSYTITDFAGNVVTVTSAQAEQATSPSSVILTLGSSLTTTKWYQATLSASILDVDGQPIQPTTVDFQFVLPTQNVSVPLSEFKGEVSGGVFGNPNGLVFFSPSLNVAAPNSIIQVENVSCCTTAYDTYTFPQAYDPSPFYLWSATAPQTTLGQTGVVLFAGFPYLSEAQFNVGFTGTYLLEPMPATDDVACSILLKATQGAPGYVALLNDAAWILNGNTLSGNFTVANGSASVTTTVSQVGILVGGSLVTFSLQPGTTYTVASVTSSGITLTANYTGTAGTTTASNSGIFICADNAGVIPVGTETLIVLHQDIVGASSMTVAEPTVAHHATASMTGSSVFATSKQASASPTANSVMRVARPRQNVGVSAAIHGGSTVQVGSATGPQLHNVSASVVAGSTMTARTPQNVSVSCTITGVAEVACAA